ncbi:MAG: plastocyanin/azurin family copper-binding protein [Saccharofermentanales bacterium]
MVRKIITLFLILAFSLGMTSCSATNTPTTGSQNTSSSAASTGGSSVSIENFEFVPAELTVKAGTTVVWTNNDSAGHDIKADEFISPLMAKGETYSFTFTVKVTYNYICGVHPTMTGKIIVN